MLILVTYMKINRKTFIINLSKISKTIKRQQVIIEKSNLFIKFLSIQITDERKIKFRFKVATLFLFIFNIYLHIFNKKYTKP